MIQTTVRWTKLLYSVATSCEGIKIQKTRKSVKSDGIEAIIPLKGAFLIATICKTKSENKTDQRFASNGKVLSVPVVWCKQPLSQIRVTY